MHRIVFASIVLFALGTGSLHAADLTSLPPLPTASGFVAGRPATQADVDAGNAVFVIGDGAVSSGSPLAIDVPQYALFMDEGVKTVVVVVQAERGVDGSRIGARKVDGSTLVGALEEFELLGTQPDARRIAPD